VRSRLEHRLQLLSQAYRILKDPRQHCKLSKYCREFGEAEVPVSGFEPVVRQPDRECSLRRHLTVPDCAVDVLGAVVQQVQPLLRRPVVGREDRLVAKVRKKSRLVGPSEHVLQWLTAAR
jgi:hypothetical protein